MDMIWHEYQRRGVRKRAEPMHFSWTAELPSQSYRHDVSVSQLRKKEHGGQGKQICGRMKTNPGFHMQLHWCVHISDHTHPVVVRTLIASISTIGSGKKEKLKKTANVIQHPLIFFYFHWCLNAWWVVALLHLLILTKSEGWISLRAAFSISFTISPQIGEAINSPHF